MSRKLKTALVAVLLFEVLLLLQAHLDHRDIRRTQDTAAQLLGNQVYIYHILETLDFRIRGIEESVFDADQIRLTMTEIRGYNEQINQGRKRVPQNLRHAIGGPNGSTEKLVRKQREGGSKKGGQGTRRESLAVYLRAAQRGEADWLLRWFYPSATHSAAEINNPGEAVTDTLTQ